MSILFLMMFGLAQAQSQSNPKVDDKLKSIYSTALLNGKSYSWLDHLSNQIGGRLSGSLNAQRAVDWGKAELDALGLDRVWLQPVMVPKWIRGTFEYAHIETSPGKTINVPICALGGSVATPLTGIKAEVINIHTIKPLDDEIILKSVAKTGCVVTAEEHNYLGGLGESVARVLSLNHPVPQEFIATQDTFGESGTPAQLMEKYGLNKDAIVSATQKVIKRK